jgi:outer membrane protein TolC
MILPWHLSGTVLTAFQQVEDNLAALRILDQEAEVQMAAVQASQRSLELSWVGVTSHLRILVRNTPLFLMNSRRWISWDGESQALS